MLNQQTMSILHTLKLFGMARSLEARLAACRFPVSFRGMLELQP